MTAAEKLLKKLESYEQDAYDGDFGADWMESVGEGFKFYVRDCISKGCRVTIAGWVDYLDKLVPEPHA